MEDRLGRLQVPNDDFTVFTCACENVRHNPIPTNCRDMASFVEVWLAWLELDWLLEVLGDVLNEHF